MTTTAIEPALPAAAPKTVYDLASVEHDYPAWSGPPTRTLLVCTHPRSGSTMLGEALHFAGGLGCPIEYFHSGFRPALMARWAVPSLAQLPAAVTRWRTAPEGVLAVKLFWPDVEDLVRALRPGLLRTRATTLDRDTSAATYQAIAECLGEIFPRPRFVHLQRQDCLRLAVSGLRAAQTQVWRQIPGIDDRAPVREMAYDPDRIARLMAFAGHCQGHWQAFFAAQGLAPLAISYEAMERDYDGSVSGLLRALGSSAAVPVRRMLRQATAQSEACALRFLREQAAGVQAATPVHRNADHHGQA
jgi:LPS sulfotransferase NodH